MSAIKFIDENYFSAVKIEKGKNKFKKPHF